MDLGFTPSSHPLFLLLGPSLGDFASVLAAKAHSSPRPPPNEVSGSVSFFILLFCGCVTEYVGSRVYLFRSKCEPLFINLRVDEHLGLMGLSYCTGCCCEYMNVCLLVSVAACLSV